MLRNHANEVGRFACVVILNEVLSLNAQEFAAGIVPEGPPPSSMKS